MSPLVLTAIVFVGVTGVIAAVAFLMRDRGQITEDRLAAFTSGRQAEETSEHAEIWKAAAFETDKKTLLEMITPSFPTLTKLFEQADEKTKPSVYFGFGLIFAALFATVSWLMMVPIYFLPLPGLLGMSLPLLYLLFKRGRRLKKFASQLPDALELVARALRAGHSLAAGMHVVAEEMPPPVSAEFGRVHDEQNWGIGIEESMRAMCERVPNLDLRFFVTSVAIQRQTGGDLAEILDKIGYVIRERYRILGQVKALTGEGRLSGVVLIALPFALFFVILHLSPGYLEPLWTHPIGIQMALFGLAAQIAGAIVIKKIVDIKV